MSVSQQKLFNYEYKVGKDVFSMRDDWEMSSRFKKHR
jgi:hypothetical protein